MRILQSRFLIAAVVQRRQTAIFGAEGAFALPIASIKKEHAMTVLTRIRATVSKRMAYIRCKNELAKMSHETAIDNGLFREDAGKMAYQAIYG